MAKKNTGLSDEFYKPKKGEMPKFKLIDLTNCKFTSNYDDSFFTDTNVKQENIEVLDPIRNLDDKKLYYWRAKDMLVRVDKKVPGSVAWRTKYVTPIDMFGNVGEPQENYYSVIMCSVIDITDPEHKRHRIDVDELCFFDNAPTK